VGIILLLAALIISVIIASHLSKPIRELISGVESISRGKLNIKIRKFASDDIGQLADAFNKMAGSLRDMKIREKRQSMKLESRVHERTRELDKRVSELEDSKIAILNMMEDVDEANKDLMDTQKKLRESLDKLRVMDVKKDEFISIAAHELKTPLTAIHGFSQLLRNRKVVENKSKRDGYLRIMDDETKRLSKLVTDILELSRIDLGTIKLVEEKINMKDVVGLVEKEMRVVAKEKGLKLDATVSGRIPNISTDQEKLTQVLLNLLNNAVKYTKKGRVTLKVSVADKHILFEVSDTGVGIPKNEYEKIFDRFYQIDSSYTRSVGGTGLGLALCKEYIELMGGRIWVESHARKGTTFYFTLPLAGSTGKAMGKEERVAREALRESENVSNRAKGMGMMDKKTKL
jgi:signal transduction histidine kinase